MSEKKEVLDGFPSKKLSPANLKDIVRITEHSTSVPFPVAPGSEWAWAYKDPARRQQAVEGLLEGKVKPADVVADLEPSGLMYDAQDLLDENGMENVLSRITDEVAWQKEFSGESFAEFISSLSGSGVSPQEAEMFFETIQKARSQQSAHEAFFHTGKQRVESSLGQEAQRILERAPHVSGTQKVLDALKYKWIQDNFPKEAPENVSDLVDLLSPEEQAWFEQATQDYSEYVSEGDSSFLRQFSDKIKNFFPKVKQQLSADGEMTQEMEELFEDLEPFMDMPGSPGSEDDPAIPPDDSDEYHTPPPGGSVEKGKTPPPFFTIEPPLTGYYRAGTKSYYDRQQKVWSKRKKLSEYSSSQITGKRYVMRGYLDTGLKSIRIPAEYAIDASSVKVKDGVSFTLNRDQTGCFYLKLSQPGEVSLEFGKEAVPFSSSPISEDSEAMHNGSLSSKTEDLLQKLGAGNLSARQKSSQVLRFINAHHSYPGGGDLQAATALQYKLRQLSGDQYIQGLDASEYLECYSANTLFCALMRRLGVPTRLEVGDHVQGARDGKAIIDQNTGHAWSRIWDGSNWVRVDATPAPKPEDMSDEQEQDKSEEQQSSSGSDSAQEDSVDSGQQSQDSQDQQNQQQTGETDESSLEEGQEAAEQAKEEVEAIEQAYEELSEQVRETDSFEDLEKIKDELKKSELFDAMEEDLEDKIESKLEEMKKEIQDLLENVEDDGFMDENKAEDMMNKLKELQGEALDKLRQELEKERSLHAQYEAIRDEVMPLVESWFEYFVERLPREQEVDIDESTHRRSGALDRRELSRPRALILGKTFNPRVIKSNIKPRFLASVVLDVSGSMGDSGKIQSALKTLVFFNELFSKISEEFGYIRYANSVFSNSVRLVKDYEHDYDSNQRYEFGSGKKQTIKARLMEIIKASGGTNMLTAIKQAAEALNIQAREYDDHAVGMYFIGDGEDSHGNGPNIKKFMETKDGDQGFGDHMFSAVMLGGEEEREALSSIFGDENTTVAGSFESLVEEVMMKFGQDIDHYLEGKEI